MGGRSRSRARNLAQLIAGLLEPARIGTVALLTAPAAALAAQSAQIQEAIPSQPLVGALEAFSRQTGVHFIYLSELVRGRRSRAVAVGTPLEEALARMLGNALSFDYLSAHSVQIMAATARPSHVVMPADATEAEMREIVVTANRREENMQNVPLSMLVLTEKTLGQINATNFDDAVRYLPGVTLQGVGPGQSSIVIRGLATSVQGLQGSGFNGLFPNVALYIDEQSVQLPFRNLDLRIADIERVEVLEGPQGTLFGAGAEAGVVRYITHKPRLGVTEVAANAGYALTVHGDPSSSADAMLNLPLLEDTLAVRAVIYGERRGGYIDTLPATFSRSATDRGAGYFGLPVNGPTINNDAIAAPAINPVVYQGIRAEILYALNPDWSLLFSQSYQKMQADGVFAEMAANSLGQAQPDLSAQLFNKSYDRDQFENSSLTLTGRLGDLQVLYAGSYLVRRIDQVGDYTNYARGVYADYYQCTPASFSGPVLQCFSPSSTWHEKERNTHQTHELRVTTPGEWRVRAVGGLFYENYLLQDQTDWYYLSATDYYNPIGPPTGYYVGGVFISQPVTSNNPNVRPLGDAFFTDITRTYDQRAIYANFDWDVVPRSLTLTLGTRYFRFNTAEVGSQVGSFGCLKPVAPDPCVNFERGPFANIDAEHLRHTYTGFRSRATLSFKPNDTSLLYYTWSQGYRAGGFNRRRYAALLDSPLSAGSRPNQVQATLNQGWTSPIAYAPDNLINNELGWKAQWLSGHLQWNGAFYQELWKHAQVSLIPSGVIGTSGLAVNGGDYRVRGIESSFLARVVDGLTFESGLTMNRSRLVREGTFYWANGTPIDFSSLRTADGGAVTNPSGTLGSPLAAAPGFSGNARLRYEFPAGSHQVFVQMAALRQSHSRASTQGGNDIQGHTIAYDLPPFTSYDAAVGISGKLWTVQLNGENLTDTRAQLFANYAQYYKGITVSRPRTLELRFHYGSRNAAHE